MGVVKSVIGGLAGAFLPGLFKKPKPPKAPLQAPPQASRSSLVNDALAGRQGSRSNRRSSGPQEASGGKKTSLGA